MKPFGRTQKAILGVLTFASVTSTVLAAVGILDGSTWSTFNIAIILGAFGSLSGGKALNEKWSRDESSVEPM